MSWYGVDYDDVLKSIDIEGDKLIFTFDCPRCNKNGQRAEIGLEDLRSMFFFNRSIEVSCQNSEVCGYGEMTFSFDVNFHGSYKGICDAPLNTPAST